MKIGRISSLSTLLAIKKTNTDPKEIATVCTTRINVKFPVMKRGERRILPDR
jgi:hypothetical protein